MPAGIVVRRYGFRVVPISIVVFGILTLGFGFLKNREGFIVMRFVLGAAEAAVLPGNAAILARYYKREEITVRIGYATLPGLPPDAPHTFPTRTDSSATVRNG